jgi:hypothetical protein
VILLRHGLHTGGVDPAVVEIEQAADHDGVVDGFVGPAGLVKTLDVGLLDRGTVAVHLFKVGEQFFLGFGDRRSAVIFEDCVDLRPITQQFRRDRGMAFDSKRTVVEFRGERGDQLTKSRAQRRRPAHDGLGETLQMLGRFRLKCEEVQDAGNTDAG